LTVRAISHTLFSMQPEARLTKKIIDTLNNLPKCYAQKNHGGPFGMPTVDITGCIDGRMFQLEVKRPGEKATARQLGTLLKWAHVGAITGIVTSPEEALCLIAHQKKN
jgi:hypothetical protein